MNNQSQILDSNKLPKVFACYNKNKRIVKKSSSGGIFYALASSIIKKYHGTVYGCVVKCGEVYHTRADTIEDVLPMLGSKYVMSDLKNTFMLCEKDLNEGKYVLFSGTPCQINALNSFLTIKKTDKEKLIGVDVICHGIPTKKYWKRYLEINFKDKDISNISFRYKEKQRNRISTNLKIGNYISPFFDDPYIKAFLENKTLSESCFNCQSKGENRTADITLGDFWGIEKIDAKSSNRDGTSLVVLRNKIDFILSILGKGIFLKEVTYLSSLYPHNVSYFKSVSKPDNAEVKDNELLIAQKGDSEKSIEPSIKHKIYKFFVKNETALPAVVVNKTKRKANNKIGIITDYGYSNYGNRLQNYALLTFLEGHGKKPYNVVPIRNKKNILLRIIDFLRGQKRSVLNGNEIKTPLLKASKRYENKTIFVSKTKRDRKKLLKFETIIVGSDQIWNANYHKFSNDLEFSLGNHGIVNRPYKLVSYAASICLPFLTDDNKVVFRCSLVNFDLVSVREKQSKDLLESIGVLSRVDVDPTLLLTENQWNKAINKFATMEPPDQQYLFMYFLGDNNYKHELPNYVTTVDILDSNSRYNMANQFDFVNFIKKSDLVATDSFHALVFCLIFGKKIILFNRKQPGMEERLRDLLGFLSLKLEYKKIYDLSKCDKERIAKAIEDSKKYLGDSIK